MTDQDQITRSRLRVSEHHSSVSSYLFRQRVVLIFVLSFLFGVLVSSFIFVSPLVSVLALAVAGAILLSEKIWNGEIGREAVVVALVVIALSLGSLRYSIKDFHETDPNLDYKVGEKVELIGVVVSEPEVRDNSIRFALRADTEKILVNTDIHAVVNYGDEITAEGKLARPEIIDDGVGRPFDYAAYLAKDDIYFTLGFASVEVLSHGHGSRVKSFLFTTKRSFVSRVKAVLSEPHSSLLAGLIVSGKDAMPKSVLEEFRRAGVIHIVVLSGYNITIIAEFIRKIFENVFISLKLTAFPRVATGVSVLGIILFVLMTGAEATVVRASIMVLAVMLAKSLGGNYSASRALLGAAFIMVVYNPKVLVYDPSFQLSFLATSALIYVVPIVERYLHHVSGKWGIRTVISTTIGTQLVVLPYLVYSTGELSLVSLPANMLILLFIPVTMLAGFIAAVLAYINIALATPLAYVAHALLSWILGVSSFFASMPLSSISIPHFPFWITLIAYLAIGSWIAKERTSLRSKPLLSEAI